MLTSILDGAERFDAFLGAACLATLAKLSRAGGTADGRSRPARTRRDRFDPPVHGSAVAWVRRHGRPRRSLRQARGPELVCRLAPGPDDCRRGAARDRRFRQMAGEGRATPCRAARSCPGRYADAARPSRRLRRRECATPRLAGHPPARPRAGGKPSRRSSRGMASPPVLRWQAMSGSTAHRSCTPRIRRPTRGAGACCRWISRRVNCPAG